MDLSKLFEMQRELDERIVRDKGLEGRDLLPEKILALQVELGELANEWRGFKFWSEDRDPREYKTVVCPDCKGMGKHYQPMTWDCRKCYGTGINTKKNPLLEEYVDCLHFILSIGLEIHLQDDAEMSVVEIDDSIQQHPYTRNDITLQFQASFYFTTRITTRYVELFNCFVQLGKMLGFTWEQIEQAYFEKNAVNHQRQEEGY